jgi:aminoglycoside 6'-N-acetyltransferase
MPISFGLLETSDLDDFCTWLNQPHLRRFFQCKPISREEVEAEYGPCIRGEDPTHCHLALFGGRPFGYIQCYRIPDYPEWADLIESPDGIGVDLAILDPAMLGRGFGRAMLGDYLRDVAFALFPDQHRCFIAHQVENHKAIACSRAVGFEQIGPFVEEGFPSLLFVLDRDKWADSRG